MRRISLLLTLCLLLFALAGCGGTSDAGDTAAPAAPETEQTDPEQAQPSEPEASPETPESPEDQPKEVPEESSPEEVPEEPAKEPTEEPAEKPAAETGRPEPEQPEETEAPEPEETGEENPYSVACPDYSKKEVESFAAQVRQAVLDRDWESLSQLSCYDIKVGEYTFADSAEFAAADWDSMLSDPFVQAMERESCTGMFCNWQGVMMGDGQIWFGEVLDIDGNNQGLKVTAINLD